MKTLDIKSATDTLASYTEDVGREPVVVTKNGKPVATLVSIVNADVETVSLSTNPAFIQLIERSRARHETEGGISPDEMPQKLAE